MIDNGKYLKEATIAILALIASISRDRYPRKKDGLRFKDLLRNYSKASYLNLVDCLYLSQARQNSTLTDYIQKEMAKASNFDHLIEIAKLNVEKGSRFVMFEQIARHAHKDHTQILGYFTIRNQIYDELRNGLVHENYSTLVAPFITLDDINQGYMARHQFTHEHVSALKLCDLVKEVCASLKDECKEKRVAESRKNLATNAPTQASGATRHRRKPQG